MNSGHERDNTPTQAAPPPDPPRRLRTPNANGNSQNYPAIREIHKNAWLKRLGPHDKKGASFIRKYEKHWVVFCVHDDVEAFLEFYSEPKMGAGHKPTFAISLNTCLHVSPSIMGQDNEYEFAVTLSTQVIRLIAANWEQMIEWVESLQGKLREMNILCPKDNLYSKLPESAPFSQALHTRVLNNSAVTTRDPNSPLPPPPNSSAVVTNSEATRAMQSSSRSGTSRVAEASTRLENNSEQPVLAGQPSRAKKRSKHMSDRSRGAGSSNQNQEGDGFALRSAQPGPSSVTISTGDVRVQENEHTIVHPLNAIEEASPLLLSDELALNCEKMALSVNSENSARLAQSTSSVRVVVNGNSSAPTSVVAVTFPDENNSLQSPSTNNCIVIPDKTGSQRMLQSPNPTSSSVVFVAHQQGYAIVNKSKPTTSNINQVNGQNPDHGENVTLSVRKAVSVPVNSEKLQQSSAPSDNRNSTVHENVYEHLFIASTVENPTDTSHVVVSRNHSGSSVVLQEDSIAPPLIPRRNPHSRRHQRNSTPSSKHGKSESREKDGSVAADRKQNSSVISSNRGEKKIRSCPADIIRPADSLCVEPDGPGSSSRGQSLETLPMEAIIGVRSGEYRIRRDDINSTTLSNETEATQLGNYKLAVHLPLKEQQVMRLKAEINHAGGVRIVLRKKDCVNSIALVDYLGAVWIAGWKQQQHPVLYYAFHVGDQVTKVAGVTVHNSAEAHRAIKMVSSMQVEFIIKRLPYGRVLVLKRTKEGEPIGLNPEGNSGEISEVVSDGLAASHGLSPRCPSADGQNLCNWFLTEINNRPLSIMARESEVKERLNAVGKEISILVQPADLVKHLRKQLKSIKGYKDYLIV